MLVVIAIIGILAAILIPAVQAAITKARNAAIFNEIKQLEMGIEKYEDKHTDYPPNFYENYEAVRAASNPAAAWAQTVLFRHLKKVTRYAAEPIYTWQYNGDFLLGHPDPNATEPTQIDAAESLVFWLAGLSSSAASPTSGGNGPLIFTPGTPPTVVMRGVPERGNAFFEFTPTQLVDADGDGIPEFAPVYGQGVPYVYFDGRSYDNLGVSDDNTNTIWDDEDYAQYPPPLTSSVLIAQAGLVKPYVTGQGTAAAGTVPVYANAGKFQIICAGLDGRFSDPDSASSFGMGDRKLFYTDVNQSTITGFTGYGVTIYANEQEDFDNIANFSGGPFEDRRPE
jgi:type II secretory pathway pseudopilin PulG